MAQLVEQLTLNQWVPGSSPGGCTTDRQQPKGYGRSREDAMTKTAQPDDARAVLFLF